MNRLGTDDVTQNKGNKTLSIFCCILRMEDNFSPVMPCPQLLLFFSLAPSHIPKIMTLYRL